MFPNFHFSIERWRKNKEYGVWVSTHGRIRLIKNKEFLSIRINQKGYCTVFTDKGQEFVHRLVAYTWLGGKRNDKYNIDHINSNKRDNSVKNLRWIEVKLNYAYAQYTQTVTEKELDSVDCIEKAEDMMQAKVSATTPAFPKGAQQLMEQLANKDIVLIANDGTTDIFVKKYEQIQSILHAREMPKKTVVFREIYNVLGTNKSYYGYTWKVVEKEKE